MGVIETNAELVSRENLTPELIVVRVLPDEGGVPHFEPGQYAELSIIEEALPGTFEVKQKLIRKQYSIASSPDDARGLEFYITLVPDGILTPKLWRLNQGDRLWMNSTIKGKFTLSPVLPGRDLILISTGTGIAPFISMLRTYADKPPWRRCTIIHGVRKAQDLAYREELEEFASSHEEVFYIPIASREPEDSPWRGLRGRVQSIFSENHYSAITRGDYTPEACQVMLCGNPAMIIDVQSLLQSQGFKLHKKKAPGQIHVERYW